MLLEGLVVTTDHFDRPDDIRTFYGVSIASGEYTAPERKAHYEGPPTKTVTREYKDHIIGVEYDGETDDLWGKPRKLCRHGYCSIRDWATDPTWLIPAWEDGETDRQSLCSHCLKKVPASRKDRLR